MNEHKAFKNPNFKRKMMYLEGIQMVYIIYYYKVDYYTSNACICHNLKK